MATLTVYPSTDARFQENDATHLETWATLRNAAGDYHDHQAGQGVGWAFSASAGTNYIQRGGLVFDTSALGAGATINSATLSLFGDTKADPNADTPNINIYSFTPTDAANLANGDYAQCGSTVYCDTAIAYAGWDVDGYNAFALNAAGLAAISITGNTLISVRNANKDVANSAPSNAGGDVYVAYFGIAQAGTDNDPKLVIDYEPGASSSVSASVSPSSSGSASGSASESKSGSASESKSLSPSASASKSLSPSASPSTGYTGYTRGNYAALPADDTDLENTYSAQDILDVAEDDTVRVGQVATLEYMVHQFKNFAGEETSCILTWNGQSSLAPSLSTVYLQIYNQNTTTWDTVDSNNTSNANTDFTLSGSVDLTNYKNAGNVISARVYQLAI